jgi:hypothetical protein
MLNRYISESIKLQMLEAGDTALAVALYPLAGSYIDVSKYERFGFLIGAGALDSELTFQVQQAKTINGVAKDIVGAVAVVAANGDDHWSMIEVQTDHLDLTDTYKYVTLNVTGSTGNDYADIWFIGFNPQSMPVTQGADCTQVIKIAG